MKHEVLMNDFDFQEVSTLLKKSKEKERGSKTKEEGE